MTFGHRAMIRRCAVIILMVSCAHAPKDTTGHMCTIRTSIMIALKRVDGFVVEQPYMFMSYHGLGSRCGRCPHQNCWAEGEFMWGKVVDVAQTLGVAYARELSYSLQCRTRSPLGRWICTRKRRHHGPHVAHCSNVELGRWICSGAFLATHATNEDFKVSR